MIKQATINDSSILAELAIQMWDEATLEELEESFTEIIGSRNAACFLKYSENMPIGFAQCSLRTDYVEGTKGGPVGYLEGIFLMEAHRKKGYAKELLRVCEKWAKDRGCSEFASDCELENTSSLQFHLAMGFEEANRIVCFRKDITE